MDFFIRYLWFKYKKIGVNNEIFFLETFFPTKIIQKLGRELVCFYYVNGDKTVGDSASDLADDGV